MTDNNSPMPNIATPTNDNCARPTRTWPPAPTIHLAEYDTFRLHHYQDYQIRKLSDLRLSTDRTLSKLSDHQIIIRSSDYQHIKPYQPWLLAAVYSDQEGSRHWRPPSDQGHHYSLMIVMMMRWWWWWWNGSDNDAVFGDGDGGETEEKLSLLSGVDRMHKKYCGFSSNWILLYFPLFVRVSVCLSQAWHLTFLTYIKA